MTALKLGTNQITVVAKDDSTPNTGSATNILTLVYIPEAILLPDFVVDEQATLSTDLATHDAELSDRVLTHVLAHGPSGMTVSPNGVLAWQPTEAQGPSTNLVEVTVTDGTTSNRKRFSVVVREVNVAPAPIAIGPQTVDELALLHFDLSAIDTDVPQQTITFRLVEGPSGLTVGTGGTLAWTPSEAQGPGTHLVRYAVSDGIVSVTNQFSIVVREVNSVPVASNPPTQVLPDGVSLDLQLVATDSDFPVQPLKFSRVSGPNELTISPTGQVTWMPALTQRPSTNVVQFSVNDGIETAPGEFRVILLASSAPPEPPQVAINMNGQPDGLDIHVRGADGVEFVLETSETLGLWKEDRRFNGLGTDTPVRVSVPVSPGTGSRFWRVRISGP